MFTVGSATAEKGGIGKGVIHVGELALGSSLDIQALVIHGRHDGPTFWINGAVHGDEINGFMVARRLAAEIDPEKLKGTIVATPLSNPLAVQWRNKVNPYDFLDMDQQFPGSAVGQYTQRAAHALFSEIKGKADFLVNFHTVATPFAAQPYTVYKVSPQMAPKVREDVERMTLAFGARANCRVDLATATGEVPGGVGGGLDIQCALAGIPAFMAEIGSGGKFEADNIAFAVRGLKNIMANLGMLDEAYVPPVDQILITKRAFLYCAHGGFLEMEAAPGDVVSAGQCVARSFDLFEEKECVTVDHDAYVLMSRVNPVVHTGDRVAFLGLEWRKIG